MKIRDRNGIDKNRNNLSNKINRGTFSFIFIMQIFDTLGINNIDLKGI
jgi:hypothetical protein